MQKNPLSNPDPSGPSMFSPRQLWHTALFACAILLVPMLSGIFFVFVFHKLSPVPAPPSDASTNGVPPPFTAGAPADMPHLTEWRRDLRNEGQPTDEADLRIWAAHAKEPEILFRVPPPGTGKTWNWNLSQDGRYAIATAVQIDALERRTVGLYDLLSAQWVWKKDLLWPDSYEQPYVFDRHTILRYSTHGKRFALEISPAGDIVNIDMLGAGIANATQPPPPQPAFPGEPVAVRNNVFFVSDAQQGTLLGYAADRLPGLRYAGRGDAHTLFSGNGFLKFTIKDGGVTVSDSLTQTVLRQFGVWRHTTNTAVTGALTTLDGSRLSVFLKTLFSYVPPVTREWSVSLALHTGTVQQSFNADALYAKPKREPGGRLHTLSPDGQWELSLTSSNDLCVTGCVQKREFARCDLASLLGLRKPFDQIAFLEEGRHAALYQGNNVWLLDFAIARTYADLLARKDACEKALSEPVSSDASTESPLSNNGMAESRTPSEATRLALYAEWFAANQAWYYAAAFLEEATRHPVWDGRTPRANLLLLARYQLLSRQNRKARFTCSEGLRQLSADTTQDNQMIRFHLQALLDAIP